MVAGVIGQPSQRVQDLAVEVYHFWVDLAATPDPIVVDVDVVELAGK